MRRLEIAAPLSEQSAAAWVTAGEWAASRKFSSESRRREWLTWRALVRRTLGREVRIAYDELGAPAVFPAVHEAPVGPNAPDSDTPDRCSSLPALQSAPAGGRVHISVSHCRGSVAVLFSDRRCAVDIETLDRNFRRLASRYMTPAEAALSDDPRWPAAVWSAKETLYKYAGRRELDLLRDLSIERADLGHGIIRGRIAGGEPLRLFLLEWPDRLAVYIP